MHMELAVFFGIGFFAQLIDGALGMAFGAISTTALLSFGLSPLHASAIVHTAEVVTTGASSAAHIVQKNLTRKLVVELALAGSLGAIIGAYILSNIDGQKMRPFVVDPIESSARAATMRYSADLRGSAWASWRLLRRDRWRRLGSDSDVDLARLWPQPAESHWLRKYC
jgi:hypothetical protein